MEFVNVDIDDKVVICDGVYEKEIYGDQTFTVVDTYWSDEKEQMVADIQNDDTQEVISFKMCFLRHVD